jgi:hypothetical protein
LKVAELPFSAAIISAVRPFYQYNHMSLNYAWICHIYSSRKQQKSNLIGEVDVRTIRGESAGKLLSGVENTRVHQRCTAALSREPGIAKSRNAHTTSVMDKCLRCWLRSGLHRQLLASE